MLTIPNFQPLFLSKFLILMPANPFSPKMRLGIDLMYETCSGWLLNICYLILEIFNLEDKAMIRIAAGTCSCRIINVFRKVRNYEQL